ncbi:MAG TPA: DMT family transporter [Thermoanaerobaculia bacterium]|nr:DMT family transporter [Thermoanaerobaculia bacterium]
MESAVSADKHSWPAALALVAVTVVWGTTFIVNAEVLGREPPLGYVACRFVFAALILNLAVIGRRRTPRVWRDGIGMGVLLALGMGAQIVGQTETSASKTAFITGLSVVLTPVVALFRTRRAPGAAVLAGVALATGGFALLSWPSDGGGVNRGDLMVLVCAVLFAIYFVENEVRSPRHDAFVYTARQMIAASVTLAAASLWLKLARPPLAAAAFEAKPFALDRGFLIAIAYMTLFATVGTFTVQNWAQARLTATRAAIIFALEPVWAAIFAAVILSEHLGFRGYAGGALVIAGIVVSEL